MFQKAVSGVDEALAKVKNVTAGSSERRLPSTINSEKDGYHALKGAPLITLSSIAQAQAKAAAADERWILGLPA